MLCVLYKNAQFYNGCLIILTRGLILMYGVLSRTGTCPGMYGFPSLCLPSLTSFFSSAHKGVPWADYWNGQMSMCGGFRSERAIQIQSDAQIQLGVSKTKELPCHPFSVIYGHCASRGLDIDRWTFGLDSGCVRLHLIHVVQVVLMVFSQVAGKKLTAMILGPNSSLSLSDVEDDDDTDQSGLDGHRDDDHFDGASVLDEDHEGNDAIKSASPLKRERTILFGEDGAAKIVQVSCKGQH